VIANVLASLGTRHALVVHSLDGLDEISPAAPTHVCEVRDGDLREYDIKPDDLGIVQHSLDAIAGGDAAENARIARRILEGELGARRETVVANAGAALYVAGAASTLREGVELARQAIDNGRALKKLEELIAVTRELA